MSLYNAILPLLLCLPLAACGNASQDSSKDTANTTASTLDKNVVETVKTASDQALAKMRTENITISDDKIGAKAEITPDGDLLINGQRQDITAEQRALLVKYRQHITSVAEAGVAIGAQGAAVGLTAAREALAAAITGNAEDIDAKVKAQTDKIEAEARRICELLPPMMATQAELASTLPAFAPYATLTQEKIDDCRSQKNGSVSF